MLGGGNCIDLDNYDGDISAAVPALVADGCRYAIVGCQDSAIALRQIDALRSGGIEVIGVYAYLYWGYDILAETARAVAVATATGVTRVYLDCERDGELPGTTPETRLAQLREAVAAVRAAGLDPGIYTGEPFWREAMANRPSSPDCHSGTPLTGTTSTTSRPSATTAGPTSPFTSTPPAATSTRPATAHS